MTKDALRDSYGHKVMLIDAGQVFRCLVVAATNRSVDLDNAVAIDAFLGNNESAEACVQFVKAVYHMEKIDREALLYTNDVSVGSAKIGARPLSQAFKDELLKKWLRDARVEGYEIVLLDGRALEETGAMLERADLCDFNIGLYFTCDAMVGALRTLGFAGKTYETLTDKEKIAVDSLVIQINERNDADRLRAVQPIVPPNNAPIFLLPDITTDKPSESRFMATIDTSASMSKQEMSDPVIRLIVSKL